MLEQKHNAPTTLAYEAPSEVNGSLILMPFIALLAFATGIAITVFKVWSPSRVMLDEALLISMAIGFVFGLISLFRIKRSAGRLQGLLVADVAVFLNGIGIYLWSFAFFVLRS